MHEAKYSPTEYKAEKVGKKFKVDILIHNSVTANPMEVTMWGDSENEAMQKMENFLKGIKPLK